MKYKKCKLVCGLLIGSLTIAGMTACGTAGADTEATSEAADTSNSSAAEEGTEASGTNEFSYTDEETETPTSTTLMARVESVDGNEITLGVAQGMSEAPSGEKPSGDAPNGDAPSGDAPSGEAPSGDAPTGDTSTGDATGDASDNAATDVTSVDSDNTDTSTEQNPASNDKVAGGETPSGEAPSGDVPSDVLSDMPSTSAAGEMSQASAVLTINDTSVIAVQGTDDTTTEGSLSDITEGTMLQITFDENGVITQILVSQGMAGGPQGGGAGNQPGGQPGQSASGVDSYDSVTNYTEDTSVSGETYNSTGTDENAILVSDGATVELSGITVDRTSSDSTGGDNSSFYGVGAAVLTTDGTSIIKNAAVTTDAAGGAGIFAYGDGTVYIADSDISTEQNTSGGIHVAGGGTLYAWDLNVETDGESAAAIRSDRGGGTMVVDGGSYISNGVGSPAVYCTADIAVNNATLTATGSEAICMEGLNTIHLFDCNITGNMQDLSQNDTTWTIIVYQSMSGDSEIGNSTMQIVGGSITSENGGLIYTTNTEADILLSDVDITYAEDSEFFLMCTGNANERGWGSTGSNGSDCTFTADAQEMEGNVVWDSISQLDFYMENGSSLKGAIVDDETYAGEGGSGYCNVYISSDSVWTVTGDSTVTNLYNDGTILDADGNIVSIVGTDGTVYVSGDSAYTITVTGYSDSADFSGAATADTWSAHEVEKPQALA